MVKNLDRLVPRKLSLVGAIDSAEVTYRYIDFGVVILVNGKAFYELGFPETREQFWLLREQISLIRRDILNGLFDLKDRANPEHLEMLRDAHNQLRSMFRTIEMNVYGLPLRPARKLESNPSLDIPTNYSAPNVSICGPTKSIDVSFKFDNRSASILLDGEKEFELHLYDDLKAFRERRSDALAIQRSILNVVFGNTQHEKMSDCEMHKKSMGALRALFRTIESRAYPGAHAIVEE